MYCPQLIDNPMHPQFHPSLGWNMGEEAFNNASLRVLFVFPSGMGVRVVSATHQALYNIVKEKYGDDVFVDICMLPVDSYRNKYFKHFPAIAGYFSKHTIEDFEVIGCSVAITMTEVVELPIFLNRAGFNVDHKSRMDDDKAPLLVVGGVAADGQSYLDSVVDLVMLGAGERTIPFLLDKVFEGQSRYGTVGKAKEWIVGACTGVKGFYNPHIYNYKHDVVDGKWQSEYLGCDIPDLGIPHHDNDLPAEVIRVNDRQLRLPLPGAEQHKLSLQSSFGCGGAASQCTFCKEGWDYGCYASHTPVFTKRGMLQIKDVQVGDEVLTHKGRFRKVTRLWRHGPKEFVPVTLMGEEIHTTLSHKWYTSDSDNAPEFKPIESNPESFKVYLPLLPKGSISVDKGIAFLTGLYLSDGNLVHRVDNDTFDGLTISGHSDHVDLYLKTFKDLGLPEPTVSHNTDKSAVTYYFSNSYNLHTAILQYVVPTDTKTGQEKDLLDCVLDWDDESVHYLILGHFFGDGAIKKSAWAGPRDYQYNVSLLGTCSALMNKLQLLCGRFYTTKFLVEERAPIRKDMFVIRFDTYSTVKFLNFAGDLALSKSVKVHPSFLTQDIQQFPRKPYGIHTEYGIAKEVRKFRAFHYDLAYTDESYDLEVEEDHSYTVGYNKFIVSNSWRERDDEDLYAGVRKAKATSFADGMSFFSFNSSFRSNYVGDLEYAAKYFNNLTALNFRMDSIAGSILHDPENNIARLVRFLGATTFACLHGSTLIETKRGLIPIEQVQVGDEVISLDYDVNKRGGRKHPRTVWSKVTHVLPRGKKPLYRFKTHNGHSLIATLDHVLPHTDTNRVDMYPDREIKDLIGRYLLTKDGITPNSADNLIDYSSLGEESPRRKYHRPERLTPNLALLLGWLMGDGYVTDRSARFVFGSSDYEAFDLIKSILDSEEIPYSLERTPGVFGVCDRINVNSLSFADFVYAMGLRGVSSDKSFPTQIYTMPTECQLAFLRGYFSADGRAKVRGANPSSKTISVSTISESILNGVATLLNHLGIKNRPTYSPNKRKHHLDWNIKPIWELNIKGRDSWRVFADNIGFIQSYKQTALSGLSSGKKTQATVKLESYEYYGEDECWDLTIEGNPYFLANGIFVHNCPIEGVSQRLRNWLNKNLTEEDILIVVKEAFKNRYTRYKMGVIWTGYETKDDLDECYDLLRRMVDIRDTSGGNTQITFNATSLVHSWGTPLYYVPRKSTYLQWLNHFSKIDNKPFYYYPWMPVVDLGIKVNASSHPVDTIIQQALVDMPGEFLRECWLKPSLEGKMASRSAEQVRLLREGMERYGIDPKKQYLEYDPLKNPHQHMTPPYLVGAAKTVSGGDLTKYAEVCSKTERGLGSCLVTPATLEKNNLTKCLACGSCPGVDKTRKQFGLKSDLPHLKWMQTRKINVKYTFEDVKTTILVNKPSFYYTFVFKVPKSSKLIANELLVRRFFVHANTVEESLVDNFRNINYSFFNTVDYSGLTPNYHGYEVVQVGFRDRLDEDKFTAIWKQTNDLMGGAIQLVKWFPSQESGSNNYLALYELDFNLSMEDFPKVVECLENEQWAWYEDIPVNPETFDLPFRYKVVKGKEGTKLFVLVRPRVNVGYSIGLRLWTYPTIHHRLSDQKIRAVFQESNGQLIDVVTGKVFDVSGFKQVDKGDSSIAAKVYEPEIGGA